MLGLEVFVHGRIFKYFEPAGFESLFNYATAYRVSRSLTVLV